MLIVKLKQTNHLKITKLLNRIIQLMKNVNLKEKNKSNQKNAKTNLSQKQKHYQERKKKLNW